MLAAPVPAAPVLGGGAIAAALVSAALAVELEVEPEVEPEIEIEPEIEVEPEVEPEAEPNPYLSTRASSGARLVAPETSSRGTRG